MADVNVYLTHHKHLSSGSLNLANLNVYWAIHSTRFQYFRIDFANFSLRSTPGTTPPSRISWSSGCPQQIRVRQGLELFHEWKL